MSHDPHEGKGLVLFDSCEECATRSAKLDGLFNLDGPNMATLGLLVIEQAMGVERDDLSGADRRAVKLLRDATRLVFRSPELRNAPTERLTLWTRI